MTAQHIPGPWNLVESDSTRYLSVVEFEYQSGAKGTVCLVGDDEAVIGASDLDIQNANARLIAAAPDLLAALIALVELVEPQRPNAGQMADARAAIARATADHLLD